MIERIDRLGDEEAVSVLRAYAGGRVTETEGMPRADDAGVRRALAEAFGVGVAGDGTGASEGEVARLALKLPASEKGTREAIEGLIDGPRVQMFADPVTGIALSAAVIAVLQTYVKFERKEDGTWTVKIEKQPTDAGLLVELVRKALGLFGGGGGAGDKGGEKS